MKNLLRTLALTSTLLLGNGCKPKVVDSYTTQRGEESWTLKDYSHWLGGRAYTLDIVKTNGTKAVKYFVYSDQFKDNSLEGLQISESNKVEMISRNTETGRHILKNLEPQLKEYFEAIRDERTSNTVNRIKGNNKGTSLVEVIAD